MVKKNEEEQVPEELPEVKLEDSATSITGSGSKQILVTSAVNAFGLQPGQQASVPDNAETRAAIANGYLAEVKSEDAASSNG